VKEFVTEFCKAKGFDVPEPSEKGVFSLVVDEKSSISFENNPKEKGFFAYALIGEVPSGKQKQIFSSMMEGNLFGRDTGHAILSYHSGSNTAILFQRFELTKLDTETFIKEMDQYLYRLTYWRDKLEEAKKQKSSGSGSFSELDINELQRHSSNLDQRDNMLIYYA